jgi:hypothetical protein
MDGNKTETDGIKKPSVFSVQDWSFTARSEDDNHAGERRGVLRIAEFQSAFDKPDFPCRPVDETVKISRIRPGGYQQYDAGTGLSGLAVAFFHPSGYFPAVGRIHENRMTAPVLFKSSVPGAKKRSHLAFSGRAQASSVK